MLAFTFVKFECQPYRYRYHRSALAAKEAGGLRVAFDTIGIENVRTVFNVVGIEDMNDAFGCTKNPAIGHHVLQVKPLLNSGSAFRAF
jgi:hypothetical protein